jgi:formimidoylglutamate deiminase
MEWLLRELPVDARWNLVHATQATPEELRATQGTGASIVLCPSTEANLGDGVFDLPGWLAAGGCWSVGSDSHVTRSWVEELRLLEYSQRFLLRQRNVAARAGGNEATASVLLQGAVGGGAAASGLATGGIAVGQRADFAVIDAQAPALAGVPQDHLLDALLFSSPAATFARVVVAGREVERELPEKGYVAAMQELW